MANNQNNRVCTFCRLNTEIGNKYVVRPCQKWYYQVLGTKHVVPSSWCQDPITTKYLVQCCWCQEIGIEYLVFVFRFRFGLVLHLVAVEMSPNCCLSKNAGNYQRRQRLPKSRKSYAEIVSRNGFFTFMEKLVCSICWLDLGALGKPPSFNEHSKKEDCKECFYYTC